MLDLALSALIAVAITYPVLLVISKCRSENEIMNNDEKEVM